MPINLYHRSFFMNLVLSAIYMDGVFQGVLDLYQSSTDSSYQLVMYEKSGLSAGSHTIRVQQHTGNTTVDAFRYSN